MTVINSRVEALISGLNTQLELDASLCDALSATPEDVAKTALVRSVPSVEPITAATLTGEVPELGKLPRRHISTPIGVAPIPHRRLHRAVRRPPSA